MGSRHLPRLGHHGSPGRKNLRQGPWKLSAVLAGLQAVQMAATRSPEACKLTLHQFAGPFECCTEV